MSENNADLLKKELEKLSDPGKARVLQSFFKTGPGEYGEGDVFLGITVPRQRKVAARFRDMDPGLLKALLLSPVHEHRMSALLIMICRYEKGDVRDKKRIADFYLKNVRGVNNWDLVDISAPKILGDYLLDKDKTILYKMARSKDLWKKRIAIVSTYAFIRAGKFKVTMGIAELLLGDGHDLIHKAVGWMLREVGKRDLRAEERFLKKHGRDMPRTMLRYAIEKFEPEKRLRYLKKR